MAGNVINIKDIDYKKSNFESCSLELLNYNPFKMLFIQTIKKSLILFSIMLIFGISALAQLNGNYTINSNLNTSGRNFQSFSDFTNSLNSSGVSGPVVVNVAVGTGPYNESVIFSNYAGMSAQNSVTINGNGERVHYNASWGFSEKRVVGFNSGAKYYIIDNLYITGNTGYGIGFNNNTEYIIIRNCHIKMSNTENNFRCAAIAATNCINPFNGCNNGSNASYITLENNIIDGTQNSGSYHAIYFQNPNSNTRANNNIIKENTITGFVGYGIFVANQDNLLVSNNLISRPIRRLQSPGVVGINYYSNVTSSNVKIERNEIFELTSGEASYNTNSSVGIYFESASSTTTPNYIQNNIIRKLDYSVGVVSGIILKNSNHISVLHNSINLTDTRSFYNPSITYGFRGIGNTSYINFSNNIIQISRTNSTTCYGIRLDSMPANTVINYNNIFVNSNNSTNVYGRINNSNYPKLIDWQNNFGANSESQNPFFISDVNLEPRAEFLNNSGFNHNILNDFSGVLRDTTPDIGAIEFDCGLPGIILNALNNTSIEVALNQLGDSTRKWQIEFDTLQFTAGNGNNRTIISKLDTINQLFFNKDYNLYVRSICNNLDTGQWSDPISFKTSGIALAGNYTIDSTRQTQLNNFQSFTDLLSRLKISGVSDSVFVNVLPGSGPYNQQVIFENINGLSANSPLIINGNGGTIEYYPTNSDKRIVGFNNVSYITLDNITIRNLHPNYGFNIHLKDNSNHITVKNSVIDYSLITQPYNSSIGVLASNSINSTNSNSSPTASNFLLQNNLIKGNINTGIFSAVYLQGGSGSSNNIIEGNDIEHFIENGIIVTDQTDLTIVGNKIGNNKNSYPKLIGINIAGVSCKNVNIARNLIENLNITNTMWGHYACGIELGSNVSTDLEPILVKNNIIRNIKSDRTHSGVRINGSGSFKIYHNTIVLVDSLHNTGDLHGIYNSNSANSTEVYNNIISLDKRGTGNSYIYQLRGYTNQFKSMNNALYIHSLGTGNKYFGTTQVPGQSIFQYNNLTSWQKSGSNIDLNSVNIKPLFFSDSILRPLNPVLRSGGANIGVAVDFYGLSRDSQPDIGAVKLDTSNYPYYPLDIITSTNVTGIADSLFVFCVTSGVVNSINLDTANALDFYIGSEINGKFYGINVSNNNKVSNYRVGVNDSLLITGQITQVNGQISFDPTDIEIIADSVSPTLPRLVSELNDSLESTLVTLNNLKLLSPLDSLSYLLTTIDKKSDTIQILIDEETDINDSLNLRGIAIGDSICSITGIVNQFDTTSPFNSGYRLIPIYFSQIDTTSCVVTDYDLAVKDTLSFDLNNCTDSSYFNYSIQNSSTSSVPWQVLSLNDSIMEDFDDDIALFWKNSLGVTLDSICETINGTKALTFWGKSGTRYMESHPMNLNCYDSISIAVKRTNSCDTSAFGLDNSLVIQYSTNDGVSWLNLKTITTSGSYTTVLPTEKTDNLLNIRVLQIDATTDSSHVWLVDDFKILPSLLCNESIKLFSSNGKIPSQSSFGLGGYISTSNKDNATVYTTIPVYFKGASSFVQYLTVQLNYNKNFCPEFDVQQLECGGSHQFTNISTGSNLSYYWDFGDGDTSTMVSPNHQYKNTGVYNVKLFACDSLGCDSISRELFISQVFGPKEPPCKKANDVLIGWTNRDMILSYVKIGPDTIFATNGGRESMDYTCDKQTILNVNSTYLIRGSGYGTGYSNVRYHAWIDYNNDGFLDLSERIMATNNGTSGQVNFTVPNNAVKDIPLRLKVFAYIAQNSFPNNFLTDCNSTVPNNEYYINRDYTVILTDSAQKPIANFTSKVDQCGTKVSFIDSSLYHPSSYRWDFGDGSISALASTTHTYTQPGTYKVKLIVENGYGTDSISKTIVIQPEQDPLVIGKLIPHCSMAFIIQDSLKYKSINWQFGNGDAASGAAINYPYSQGGIYPIELNRVDTFNCQTRFLDTLNIVHLGDTAVACDSFTWIDGNTYTESTTTAQYIFATDPLGGCDSIITLNLTINKSSLQKDTIINCDRYYWDFNHKIYYSSGTYIDTISTQNGCDSIRHLDLTIKNNSSLIDTVVRCNSYTWPQNGITYSKTGIYIDTLINAIGCDSLRTLDLTINSNLIIDTLTVLDSMYWAQTGLSYYTSGFYVDSFINRFGCDSIIALKLKVNSSDAAKLEYSLSKNRIDFSTCNNDSASFDLIIYNRGDVDGLSWNIYEEIDNGLYFDNFESGIKSTLWQSTYESYSNDSCGSIFGNGALRFDGNSNRFVQSFPLNTSNADTLFFSLKNNGNCDTLILGSPFRVRYFVNNLYWTLYSTSSIQHFDTVIHYAFPLPSSAKGTNVGFILEQPMNWSTYPYQSDITVDNFRIGGNAKTVFSPYRPSINSGFIPPLDSQVITVNVDRNALEVGMQFPKLFISSNDSLNSLDSILMPVLLDGTPCSDFLFQTLDCNSAIQFSDSSKGDLKSWHWDFGDGNYSTEQHPVHSYQNQGVYQVTLTACSYFACDTISKSLNSNYLRKPKDISCNVDQIYLYTSGITKVKYRSIDNTSSNRPYQDFTCFQTGVSRNSLDTIEVSTNSSQMSVYVFIDFNNNASFEASEKVLFSNRSSNHVATIQIDSNAVLNEPLRMRIGTARFGTINTLDGCNVAPRVEYEDYTIIVEDSSYKPTAILAYEIKDSCFNSVSFSDLSLNYASSWFWDFGDGNTSQLKNPNHFYQTPGNYEVSLKVNNTIGVDSTTIMLDLNKLQIIDSVTNNSPTLIANEPFANYQWLDCNQNFAKIIGETYQSFTASQNGSYAVEVSKNGCVDTSQCIQLLNVFVNDINKKQEQFSVYPNPNTGHFQIISNINQKGDNNLYVLNEFGQKIEMIQIISERQKISLEGYSNGIYYLKYKEQVEKIIIIR